MSEKKYVLKLEDLYCFLLILYYLANFLSLRIYGMGSDNSKIRYYVLLFITIMGFFLLLLRYKDFKLKIKNHSMKIYGKKLLLLIPVSLLFLIFSIKSANDANMPLSIRTFVQISLILFPAIYSFFLVNIVSTKKIINVMRLFLFMTIIIYLSEDNHNIIQFLNLSNYKEMLNGYFFIESNLCTDTFFQLFLFFNFIKYFNDEYKDNKIIKKDIILSAAFAFLCHKRLTSLFVIITLIIGKKINNTKEVKKVVPIFISILICILTVYYTLFLQKKIFTDLDVFTITTGRNYIMRLWSMSNYFSYGYGTSMLVINRYLEMDLVEIYMELNLLCLFVYCYTLLLTTNRKHYAMYIMIYILFKLLTATYLTISFPWIIAFITIVLSSEGKIADEKRIYMEKNEGVK